MEMIWIWKWYGYGNDMDMDVGMICIWIWKWYGYGGGMDMDMEMIWIWIWKWCGYGCGSDMDMGVRVEYSGSALQCQPDQDYSGPGKPPWGHAQPPARKDGMQLGLAQPIPTVLSGLSWPCPQASSGEQHLSNAENECNTFTCIQYAQYLEEVFARHPEIVQSSLK